jgi:putative copper resistance protein D
MAWLGVADGPLIAIRALHFAASAMTTGAVVFGAVVGKPALGSEQPLAKLQGKLTLGLASVGLAITVFSGAIWFVVQAAAMSGEPLDESLTSRVLLPVLNQTQFGQVCEVRIILALVLAACLAYRHFVLANELSLAASLGLIAAIAWAGHAGSTPDELGGLHLATDALHLVAAAVWIGGLVPLVLLLRAARWERNGAGLVLAHALTRRFSVLAMASVAALLGTGFVNAWILVGSLHALLVTEYGRLLMLKLAVFAIMLLIAAVNRFWLTPRLDAASGYRSPIGALGQLTRTGSIEIALGLAIFAIVGMLGTLHPAIHFF